MTLLWATSVPTPSRVIHLCVVVEVRRSWTACRRACGLVSLSVCLSISLSMISIATVRCIRLHVLPHYLVKTLMSENRRLTRCLSVCDCATTAPAARVGTGHSQQLQFHSSIAQRPRRLLADPGWLAAWQRRLHPNPSHRRPVHEWVTAWISIAHNR